MTKTPNHYHNRKAGFFYARNLSGEKGIFEVDLFVKSNRSMTMRIDLSPLSRGLPILLDGKING